MNVFLLEHCYLDDGGRPHRKQVGLFTTRERALAAYESRRAVPGFARHPDLIAAPPTRPGSGGFVITEYEVDRAVDPADLPPA